VAPNLKHLPKEKFTEAVIFAGTDAYAHAKGWEEGMGKQIAEDRTPPIYLGPKQLAELENLQIIDKGRRSARVYLAGNIEPILINAIGEKLAQAGVQDARLYKEFLTKSRRTGGNTWSGSENKASKRRHQF
jgi:putative DNA primase/helicase